MSCSHVLVRKLRLAPSEPFRILELGDIPTVTSTSTSYTIDPNTSIDMPLDATSPELAPPIPESMPLAHHVYTRIHAQYAAMTPLTTYCVNTHADWSVASHASTEPVSTDTPYVTTQHAHAAAIASYRPHLVIITWQPAYQDVTQVLRHTESVQEVSSCHEMMRMQFDDSGGCE